MIYTKTGEYAIRAILYLARKGQNSLSMASEIAKKEDIPSFYLSKILQKLAKLGYVESYKGRGGGFKISQLALKSTILEIIEKIEGPIITYTCVTGFKECSDDNPCPMHYEWKKLREEIKNLISTKTVEEISKEYSAILMKPKS
jgi:Rrf2 family protein